MSAQDATDIVTATHFVTWAILPLELAATFPSKSVEESSTTLLLVFPSNLFYKTFGKLSTFAHGANSLTTAQDALISKSRRLGQSRIFSSRLLSQLSVR
jgi:hypothetical protein